MVEDQTDGRTQREGSIGTLNAGGARAIEMRARLAVLAKENLTRVPCRVCAVPILPGNYWSHVRLHED